MTKSKNYAIPIYQQLKHEERGIIQTLIRQKVMIGKITRELHRISGTIRRGIRRGTVKQCSSNYIMMIPVEPSMKSTALTVMQKANHVDTF